MAEPRFTSGRANEQPDGRGSRSTAPPSRIPGRLIDLGFVVRARAWWLMRGAARALRPVIGPKAFGMLYGLGRVGYLPRIEEPRTFVEKLLWLKHHYRHPLMPTLVDKLAVRDYVRAHAPELRLPDVYTVSESADGFSFEALPERAVIKPSHASGLVTFWEPGSDRDHVRRQLRAWLAKRQHEHLAEWFYESITPRVFAEQDLRDARGAVPPDYKVFVLNGRAHGVQVFVDRTSRLTRTMFDREWRIVPVWRSVEPGGRPIVVADHDTPRRPDRLADLLAAAERLAAPFPFARVDLYAIRSEIYFGEITFMPGGGYVPLLPRRYDLEYGEILKLPPIGAGPDLA